MLPSGWKNCERLNALNSSPWNSSRNRSLSGICFWKLNSQLFRPGPQQTVRGAFPMVPGVTVSLVKASGLNPALINVQVAGSVPVPAAQVSFRGSMDLKGAAIFG